MGDEAPVGEVDVPEALQRFQDNVIQGLADLDARLRELEAFVHSHLTERKRPELDENQRREMRVVWPTLVCRNCGTIHPGICPRVREMTYHPNGNVATERFWKPGEWEPPWDAVRASDVFPGGVVSDDDGKQEQ